jgi:hypothetical protein
LNPPLFGQIELTANREVELSDSKATQRVALQRALPSRRGNGKGIRIEPSPAGGGRIIKIDGNTRLEVETARRSDVERIEGLGDGVEGQRGAEPPDRIDRPVPKYRACQSISTQKPPRRNVVGEGGNEVMSDVKV